MLSLIFMHTLYSAFNKWRKMSTVPALKFKVLPIIARDALTAQRRPTITRFKTVVILKNAEGVIDINFFTSVNIPARNVTPKLGSHEWLNQ